MHDEPYDPTCDDCKLRVEAKKLALQQNFEENWAGIGFMSVPGGASVARLGGARGSGLTPSQSQKKFDGDLTAYSDSKAGGLQPDQTSKEGVERVERRVEANARVQAQHDKGDIQLGETLTRTIEGDFA